jgi:hypothetical protein
VNLQMTRRLLAGFSLAAVLTLVVACSAPSSFLSPTAPTAASAASAASGASFKPNPDCPEGTVFNPITGLCELPPPPPPPPGVGCSPGYWKNHVDAFNSSCSAAAALAGDRFATCADLWTALICKGSDASCGRNEAAAALDTVSGCTETD